RSVDRRCRVAARSPGWGGSSPAPAPSAAGGGAGSPGGGRRPGGGARGGGAGREQRAGAGAIGGEPERFGQPADGGGYDGHAMGERFGDGHAVGLRAGRRDEQVGRGVRVAERRAGQDAGEPDAAAVAEARDTGLQVVDEVRVALERSGQHAMPVPLGEVGERLDEEVLPLVAAEDSDADQVAADGPGG